MTYYAIKSLSEGEKYLGSLGEKEPIQTHYYLFSEEMAQKRLRNAYHPDEWEVVISPKQTEWNHRL